MTLVTADLQAIAKIKYGCSGIVYFVWTSGNNSSDGLSWATAFLTLSHAAGVAVAGDAIVIGAGAFTESAGVVIAAGVNVCGAGEASTNVTINATGALLTIGGTSEFRDFEVTAANATQFMYPIAVASGADCILRRMKLTGITDCIYFDSAASAILRAYECQLNTQWDFAFIEMGTNNLLELHDCFGRSIGPGPVSPAQPYFSTGVGISGSATSVIRIYGGAIISTDDGTRNIGCHTDSGQIALSRLVVQVSGAVSSPFTANISLYQESTGSILVCDVNYDVTLIVGTISVRNTALASGAIDVPTLSNALAQLLVRGYLITTGTTTPVSAAADWQTFGLYLGVPYYFSPSKALYAWTDATYWYITPTAPGVALPAGYFKTASAATVTGPYTFQGTATGTPVVTVHGNSILAAFQPEIAPLQQSIADALKLVPTTGSPAAGSAQAQLNKVGAAVTLAANGLDSIAITAPTGRAGTFREMVVQLWRRQFRRVVDNGATIKTYADDGTTVITAQTVSQAGGTQTLGSA